LFTVFRSKDFKSREDINPNAARSDMSLYLLALRARTQTGWARIQVPGFSESLFFRYDKRETRIMRKSRVYVQSSVFPTSVAG